MTAPAAPLYIGTKIIRATPMTRLAYNEYRGWQLPQDECGEDAGYLVEYLDGGKPNHQNHIGYISWSPAEQFEKAYRKTSGLTFGLALEALKAGRRVTRSGWNGKGMWLVLVPGTPSAQLKPGTPYANALGLESCEILPHIDMWTVNASGRRAMLPGWLASQSDMLAEDWQIVGQEQPSAPPKKVYTANDIMTIEAHTMRGEIVAEMRDRAKVTVTIEPHHFRSGVLTWDQQIQLVLDKINAQQ